MPTYTDVTNLPSTPASLSDADTHLSLTTPGINAQHYEWQGNSAGFWNPVNDDAGGTATATYLTLRAQKFSYDFDVDGGSVGDITLRGGEVPSGAIIIGVAPKMTTALDGPAGTTVGLSLETANDLQTQQLISDIVQGVTGSTAFVGAAVMSFSGLGGVLASAAPYLPVIETTAVRSVVMPIGVHAITVGKYDVYITYMVPA